MKALIVFDVNDFTYEAIEQYFSGDITLHLGNDGYIDFKDVMLQPMPQKKYAVQGMNGYSSTVKECKGYNKCIDEILGEEE